VNSHDKAKTGQLDGAARMGESETGQPGRDSRDVTARVRQPRRYSQEGIARTGQPGWDREDKTATMGPARAGEPRQES
jgi:hypothetical protein